LVLLKLNDVSAAARSAHLPIISTCTGKLTASVLNSNGFDIIAELLCTECMEREHNLIDVELGIDRAKYVSRCD